MQENTSRSGESVEAAAIPNAIMCYQKYGSEKPDDYMRDDTFPTSKQNTEPYMVNVIQFPRINISHYSLNLCFMMLLFM